MSRDPRELPLNDVARAIMVQSNYDPHFSGIEERVIMETKLFLARYDALKAGQCSCDTPLVDPACPLHGLSVDISPQWLQWAVSTFGDIARDKKERALRFIEEAIELVQAIGVEATTVSKIADRVYSRPSGTVAEEIGQSRVTLDLLAYVVGLDPRAESVKEFDRVRSIPKEEWDRRHTAKVELGIATNWREGCPHHVCANQLCNATKHCQRRGTEA